MDLGNASPLPPPNRLNINSLKHIHASNPQDVYSELETIKNISLSDFLKSFMKDGNGSSLRAFMHEVHNYNASPFFGPSNSVATAQYEIQEFLKHPTTLGDSHAFYSLISTDLQTFAEEVENSSSPAAQPLKTFLNSYPLGGTTFFAAIVCNNPYSFLQPLSNNFDAQEKLAGAFAAYLDPSHV